MKEHLVGIPMRSESVIERRFNMFVIKDKDFGDYLAEYLIVAEFTPKIVNCFQYKTYKGALKALHYYQLGATCEIVEVREI